MQRRHFLLATGLAASLLRTGHPARAAGIDDAVLFHDPDAPEAGNPQGDIAIAAFTDYNCPFCKKSAPDLDRVVREDGKIRLVYKDLPILTEASVYGARWALAAKYQGKYDLVHHALMAIPGGHIPQERMFAAVGASGVDMTRLQADLLSHAGDIAALLQRNLAQARALGVQGTPTYVVGPFIASTLDYSGFKEVVAEARQRQATKAK